MEFDERLLFTSTFFHDFWEFGDPHASQLAWCRIEPLVPNAFIDLRVGGPNDKDLGRPWGRCFLGPQVRARQVLALQDASRVLKNGEVGIKVP